MTTANTAQETDRDAGLGAMEALLREVRDHLRYIQRSLDEEIRGYPTPIPRCDAQFNRLFEQRDRLYRALERIEAPDPTLSRADCVSLLEEFAASPHYGEDAAEEEIRARVRVELSRSGR
jgi:hypothetical protein